MFPSQKLSHDEAVARARRAVQAISMQKVGDVFLASLTTRRLEWRSALGNYAVAKQLPDHTFMGDEKWCQVCYAYKEQEADWNVLNFERYKWGGVRHDHVEYAAFDLEQLSLWEIPTPTVEDLSLFRAILATARSMPPDARIRDLEKAIGKVVKSNQSEREVLLQILGYCGILASSVHPGFNDRFIPWRARDFPPASKLDWSYPACWWRGSNGVNDEALAAFFPQLEA